MYLDTNYFDLWAVRPVGDKNFNSPRLFLFVHKKDAEAFKKLIEIAK